MDEDEIPVELDFSQQNRRGETEPDPAADAQVEGDFDAYMTQIS